MKIILLVGIFSLPFINISAEKTIKLRTIGSERGCTFSGVTIKPNETVSVQIDPGNEDSNKIMYVKISYSSIHSIPREIFAKFTNMKGFWGWGQKVREIKPDTFWETLHNQNSVRNYWK